MKTFFTITFSVLITLAILLPLYYDKVSDDTIKLYPSPTATYCTLTAGLKVHFRRTAHLFTASDTDAVPGFASPYHVILAYMASIPCIT